MDSTCDYYINCDCMKCPIFAHEHYEELGYYESNDDSEYIYE